MKTLGLRHVALNVSDPQRSKEFYVRVFKMQVEWEPDPDNIYLTSHGMDNLAIHPLAADKGPAGVAQRLDHIGFALPDLQSVDEWYQWIKENKVPIAQEIKTHRDGARSFYIRDPDGIVVQLIYHPPIAKAAQN
ncbi:MAG: VOC family protein [Bdellovibrionales bacterium]|nr:VOC family protein [Bdellovibrionales bacterium]